MRKLIFCLLLLTSSAASFSQQDSSTPALPPRDYMRESRTENTIAWILTGVGAAVLAGTVAVESNFDSPEGISAYYAASIFGVASGIALFVDAGVKKRKARKQGVIFALATESTSLPATCGIRTRNYPSLALRVKL